MWRLPWISRSSHEEMVQQLNCTISDLKQVVDRLATTGLGYPLYSSPSLPDSSPTMEAEEEITDPAEEALQRIMNIRQPSKRADAITAWNRRQASAPFRPPSVARIPQMKVNQALDDAEKQGKRQA